MIAVVADGAGTASRADEGARLACRCFLESSKLKLNAVQNRIQDLDNDFALRMVKEIREEIDEAARQDTAKAADYACTFLCAIVGSNEAMFCQLGDGAIIFQSQEDPKWRLAGVAQRGEYANVTTFITSPNAESTIQSLRISTCVTEFALMSDGVEILAVKQASGSPHAPFLDHVFEIFRTTTADGLSEEGGKWLNSFLGSSVVCSRTDDDKSLVLATRIPRILPNVANR